MTTPERTHTYVGVTNNLKRRTRQHNGGLVGGARATRTIRGKTGRDLQLLYHVTGLPTRKVALQLEWRLHRRTFDAAGNAFGLTRAARRAWQLYQALQLERVTKNAPRTADLSLCIHWHDAAYLRIARALPWIPATVRHIAAVDDITY